MIRINWCAYVCVCLFNAGTYLQVCYMFRPDALFVDALFDVYKLPLSCKDEVVA